VWLFPLSKVPVTNSIQVFLDKDGDGTQYQPQEVPPNNEGAGQTGYIYYGLDKPAPYTNSVSFEKLEWPPLNSLIIIRYTPAG